ncbi:transporter substrate-binding domain-containing protein [Aminobacter aminovorans]|uniref:transporter substrate-binding domain-containing protein n=1 Tax=Aminobacter aminovorans TaxID=83263 RepID=UPI002861D657|nr:transporter substrate-binding domain-containing protein [Aminobacter aminovorans]MDR7221238.1 ABC-type amino acid transport substrate-binding protein [Aminobacter aminovorans]
MPTTKKLLASFAAAAFACTAFASAALAQSGTDQVVLGKTITKDEAAAALVPAKFNGTLRLVVSAPYAPWMFFDDKNELTGIEIDVVKTVAAKMGVKVTFDNIKFEGTIPSLQAGKADMIAAGMGDNKKREQILNFINYTTLGLVVLTRENNTSINGLMDLCGKSVSRINGDVFGPWVEEKLQPKCQAAGKEKIDVRTYPDPNAALLAVKSGSVDSEITGLVSATTVLNSKENAGQFRIIKPENSARGWKLANGGFAVLKSETELTKAIEVALKATKAEGTLKAIAEHYGYPDVIIDEIVVNQPEPAGNLGGID